MQVQYGNHVMDTANFPPATIDALLRRGLSHVLGNEAASKVSAWEDAETKRRAENGGAPITDDEKSARKNEFQLALIEAMNSGTLGQSNRGPRIDPVEAARQAIAKREVIDVLRGAGLKQPKGDAKVKFADGQEFTMGELVNRRLDKHGERITREAQKHVAELERKAKKAKEEASKAGATANADALGL